MKDEPEVDTHAHDDEGYPRPRIPLAANWMQPKRPYDPGKDYFRLPRHRPDYGRAPIQHARRRQ